jgi:hypothetical protein
MNLGGPPVGAFPRHCEMVHSRDRAPFVPDTIEPIIHAGVVGAGHHGNPTPHAPIDPPISEADGREL